MRPNELWTRPDEGSRASEQMMVVIGTGNMTHYEKKTTHSYAKHDARTCADDISHQHWRHDS